MTTAISARRVPAIVPGSGSTASIAIGIAVAVLLLGGAALGVHGQNVHNGLIALSFTAVGLFVIWRRPGNAEARLFIAAGGAHAVMYAGRQYGLYAGEAGDPLPAAEWVTWIGVWPLPLVLAVSGIAIMSFPDGRLPSTGWRVVAAATLVAGAVLAVMSALWPVEVSDIAPSVPHPLELGGAEAAQDVWSVAGPASYLLFQLAWLVCVAGRLHRARGDEKRQLTWFVYAVAVAFVAMIGGLAAFGSPVLGVLAVPIIPIAAGSAILKYRLYDIDVVVNKTLVVGAMAAFTTAAYVVVVAGVGGALGFTAGPSFGVSLVATALIAVAFDPVRRRVQRRVDRLVYGDRPSPYEALAHLSGQLARVDDRSELFAGLASTVAQSVGAREVTLWVGGEAELVAVASWPPDAAPDPGRGGTLASLERGGETHVRPILHQDEVRGAVTLTKAPGEVLTAREDRLLSDLAAQAGLVIDNVGLGAELQQRLHQISLQAGEIRAAARRLVAAQDEARRRIERDLHDGAQQRLVTLALSLQAIDRLARETDEPALVLEVEDARRQLVLALADLREMARGIHPTLLTEGGLDAALGALTERSPIPVDVDLRLDRQLAPEVEVAGYFMASEALTNAAKHSHASGITVTGGIRDDRLMIEVVDDGCGGADRDGSGLQGLADRLATLNGRLIVDSPEGCGTRVRAEIPCA